MRRSNRIAVCAVATIAAALNLLAAPAAWGQSAGVQEQDGLEVFPRFVSYPKVERGAERATTVDITNTGGEPVEVRIERIGATGGWLRAIDATGATADVVAIGAGDTASLDITVLVPDAISNGIYTGGLVLDELLPHGIDGGSRDALAEIILTVEVTGEEQRQGSIGKVAVIDAWPAGIDLEVTIHNGGNIIAVPTIVAVATARNRRIGEMSSRGVPIGPRRTQVRTARWIPPMKPSGDLQLAITVLLDNVAIDTMNVQVQFPVPDQANTSLHLDGLELVNRPEPGGIARVLARVSNDGESAVRARFVGEIRVNGSELVPVGSFDHAIEPASTSEIEVFMDIGSSGVYTLVGLIDSEGFETEQRSLTFEVQSMRGPLENPLAWLSIALSASLLALLGTFVVRSSTRI